MVLVIIILMAWVVILGPSLVKRRARSGGVQSITHFHYQLRVLEHSAPEPIVAPAYRLRAVDGSGVATGITYPDSGTPPVLTVVGAKQLPRPALAFLGDPVPGVPEAAAPVAGRSDVGQPSAAGHDEVLATGPRRRAIEQWAPPPSVDLDLDLDLPVRSPDAPARQLARRRRRDTLMVLAATLMVLLLLGAVTGSTAAWVLSLVAAGALAAYVALLVHLRRMAEEREAKLHYLDSSDGRTGRPGGPPVYASGRYAHPSNQQAIAR